MRFTPLQIATAAMLLAASGAAALAGEAEDQFTLAAGHYERGRWSHSLEEFTRLTVRFPSHPLAPTATFFQGESLHQLKRYEEARQRYQAYLATDDTRYQAHARFRCGECSALAQQHERALGELDSFLRHHPRAANRGYAQLYRGQSLFERGDLEQARAAYMAALADLNSQTPPPQDATEKCRYGLARCLLQLGEPQEAVRFLEFVASGDSLLSDDSLLQIARLRREAGELDSAHEAVDEFRRRFADSPVRDYLELLAAGLLSDEGRHADAAELLRGAVTDATSPVGASMLYQAGLADERAGDIQRADDSYTRLLRRWPDDAWADDALHRRVLLEVGDTVALCRELLDRYGDSPHAAQVREILGETLLRQGDYEEAAEALAPLMELSTHRDHVGYLLLLARMGADQTDAALQAAAAVDVDQLDQALQGGMLSAHGAALMRAERYREAADVLGRSRPLLEGDEASRVAAQQAVALARLDEIDEAVEVLATLASDSPHREETARFVAACARQLGHSTQAATLLAELVEVSADPADLAALSETLWQSQRREAADQQLQRLQTDYPSRDDTRRLTLRRGRQWEALGDHSSALQCYNWLGGHGDLRQQRTAQFLAARIYEQTGRDAKAAELLRPLTLLDPQEAAGSAPQDAVLYHLGWALLDLGHYEEAARAFSQLADAPYDSPLKADAVYRLARIQMRQKQTSQAAQRLDELAGGLDEDHPLRGDMLLLRSHAAAMGRQWRLAQQCLEELQAVEATPRLKLDGRFFLAESLFRQRQFAAADKHYEAVLAAGQAAKPEPRWLPMARLRRGQILAQQQQWRAAERAARELLEVAPQFTRQHEVHYLLGRSLAARARFSEAREAYQQAISDPRAQGSSLAAKAQWMIGESFFHQRDYEQAIRAYHRVELLHKHPEWQALALLQAARCHDHCGRFKEAADLRIQVLSEFPNTRAAKEVAADASQPPAHDAAPGPAGADSPAPVANRPNRPARRE